MSILKLERNVKSTLFIKNINMTAESQNLSEFQLRRIRREFLANQNEGLKYEPVLFNLPQEINGYESFRSINSHTLTDEVLPNLLELYKRFPTTIGFLDWLHQNDFSLSSKKRIAIAHGINEQGKVTWDITAVPPENLQRQLQDASASEMMNDLNGKIETVKELHENVDLIVIGCSVGSNIAATLAAAIGAEHFTLVDGDIQDGVGGARVDDPRDINDGRKKVFKLRDGIKQASPYAKIRSFPEPLTIENIDRVFSGVMPDNPNRKLIIIEEVDNLETKDLIRRKLREKYAKNGNAIIISVADAGRAAVKMVAEEPEDTAYQGLALKYTKDPYAKDLNPIAKILATYGLVTRKGNGNPIAKNIQTPPELLGALDRLMKGKIKSFEQSGLASRLAGVVVGQTILSWIEGNLETKALYMDMSVYLDKKWTDKTFVKDIYKKIREFQKTLHIKELKNSVN